MSPLFRSYAKINLHLEVLGPRPDGYHELRTVFQTVDLADTIEIEAGPPGVSLRVPAGGAPDGEANLACRAAARFLQRWAPGRGVQITLTKRIPAGGGLGGGSSDAATVLMGMREIFSTPSDEAELTDVARDLGADVPYFLVGGTALGTGRGDEIRALPDLRETYLWLATPAQPVATAEVFSGLEVPPARPAAAEIESWLAGGSADWDVLAKCRNDLEETVLRRYEGVRNVYNALLEAGASPVRLSGSGSTLFARFGDFRTAGVVASTRPSETSSPSTPLRDMHRSYLEEVHLENGVVRVRTLTRSAVRRLRRVR